MAKNNPYYNNPQSLGVNYTSVGSGGISPLSYNSLDNYESPISEQELTRGMERAQNRLDLKGAKAVKNPWMNSELAGKIAGGVTGGLEIAATSADIFGDIQSSINEYRDMRFQNADTMINGVPSYSGVSGIGQQANGIDPSNAGKGLVGQSALKGAMAGSSLMAINPIVGGVATGIGAIGGAIAGAFGKNKAQMRQRKRKKKEKDCLQPNRTIITKELKATTTQ